MYDGDLNLSELLPGFVQNYADEFDKYWSLDKSKPVRDSADEEEFDWYRVWNDVADDLLDASSKLDLRRSAIFHKIDVNELLEILEAIKDEGETKRFVEQRIEIGLADELQWELETRRKNVIHLLRFLVRPINSVQRTYLSRVSECFMRGMHAETVIMCGSALEAALEDFTEDVEEQIRKHFKFKGRFIPVSMRREYLADRGILSKHLEQKAERISQARNDAAHLRIDVLPAAEEILQDLADVLRGLAPPELEVDEDG